MTAELLQFLRSQNAFDHQPTYEALREVHVPFDGLSGTPKVEARLEEAGYRNGRVALIGSSGCGKSSVISYVFGPELQGVAPLVVPVRTGRDTGGRVGVSFGWIKGELGTDLARQTEAAVSITPEEKLEVVQQLLFQHLFRIYEEGKHHLRWAIRTAHVALTEACDAGSDRITAASIDADVAADQ